MGAGQINTSTYLEHEETIFKGGSGHYHKTFKQQNNT